MKKMSVEEAARFFGVSKEAIHNRIRRGSLQSVVENGLKLVVVDEKKKVLARKAVSTSSSKYQKFLEEQNAKLQQRIEKLEDETRTLRDQKEQMLIEERKKLERIYKEKDEQLKNILQTVASKFMLEAPAKDEEVVTFDAQIDDRGSEDSLISLKKHLKSLKLSEKKMQRVLKKFKKLDDERVVRVGKKIYVDPSRYDYGDLL
ncbi:MAG: DNA-binding protein [Epsilonproteobacteria bacterium]|nr:DNA-binding protein [Campylobacterota bacterium]